MLEVLPSHNIMHASGMHEGLAMENSQHDLRVSQSMKEEAAKMKRFNSEIMKGLMIPDRTGEQEIKREFEWFEEEMKYREAIRTQENGKKEQSTAELADLRTKEQNLDQLKHAWQLKNDEITLQEAEQESLQKEFNAKVNLKLKEAMDREFGSSEVEVASRSIRMKEEALRKTITKSLKQDGEDAKTVILLKVEEKLELEREMSRLQKDIGLMKQKIRARVRSQANSMAAKKKQREAAEPQEIPSNEELYAPKNHAPRPVILSSYNRRLEEAKAEKAEKRAKVIAQRKQNIRKKKLAARKAAAVGGSSSSSSSSNPHNA